MGAQEVPSRNSNIEPLASRWGQLHYKSLPVRTFRPESSAEQSAEKTPMEVYNTGVQDVVGGPYVMGQPAPAIHPHARKAFLGRGRNRQGPSAGEFGPIDLC